MAGKCPRRLKTQFIKDSATLTSPELAEKYGRAESTMRDWRMDLFTRGELLWWPGIRIHESREFVDQPRIHGDTMIISDLEIPFHDVVSLGYMVAIAQRFGIKRVLIAGDFVALDAESWWDSEEGDWSDEYSVADTVFGGKMVLHDLLEWFEHIYLIKGNHEKRGSRKRELGFLRMCQNSWGELGDVELSYYRWAEVYSGDTLIQVEHPKNYSKIPLSVSRERASIEDRHVACAHTHHFAWGFAMNGKHMAIDLGHNTRPEQRWYKTVEGPARYPKWIRGFWMVRNGYVYPFPVDFVDWNFWLREISINS